MDPGTESSDFYKDTTTELELTTIKPNNFNNNLTHISNCNLFGEPIQQFLIGGVGVTLSSLVGIIGNILCIIILTRPRMRSSTSIILLGLSVADLIYVTISFVVHGVSGIIQFFCAWPWYINIVLPVIIPTLYGIISTAQVASIYCTVAVSVERYIVVYRPLQARSICTVKNANRTLALIIGFAILFTLPMWWTFYYTDKYYMDGNWAGYMLKPTALSLNRDFIIYYLNWGWLIVIRIIPFTMLILTNVSIYRKVRTANAARKAMTSSESNEISLAKMLIWIATIFLVCHALIVYTSMRVAFINIIISIEMVTLVGFFLNLNSAVNFIIYCLVGGRFRETFAQIFCGRTRKKNYSSTLTYTSTISPKSSLQSNFRNV